MALFLLAFACEPASRVTATPLQNRRGGPSFLFSTRRIAHVVAIRGGPGLGNDEGERITADRALARPKDLQDS